MNDIILLICTIIVLASVTWIFVCIDLKRAPYEKISFKESLDLTDLPIITFEHNGRKLNFLLDTGANKSIINKRELETCSFTKLEDKNQLTGLDGITRVVHNVELVMAYKENLYKEKFQVTDMSSTFDTMKQETGVSVHGIIGNQFFKKYRYVLDFGELVAYSKTHRK